MRYPIVLSLLLLLCAAARPGIGTAQGAEPAPADFLPSGVSILQTVSGDVDGDGRDDLVTLYSMQSSATALARASVLVLLTTDSGVQPVHLFGEPPTNLRGEPALDPNGSAEIILGDVNGDDRPEIQFWARVRFQEPTPRTMLWVFGRGDSPEPAADDSPPLSPLARTGFRLEAYLDGSTVTVAAPGPLNPDRSSVLHREASERRLGGPDPGVQVAETHQWQQGAFRLTERSLTLPSAIGATARSPETAVLAFYEATARGDLETATALLGDDLRASRSAPAGVYPAAVLSQTRVEEVRTIDEGLSGRERPDGDRRVYVRVSMFDPRVESPPLPDPGDWVDRVPAPLPPRSTIAGTWRTQKVGEQWRLVAADLHETANLDAISRTLPPGVNLVQSAGADLRNGGVEDLVVLATDPGRLSLMEPYLVYGSATGPERSVPLASFVDSEDSGVVGGTVRADDINGDGTPEVSFSAFVGAHSALLWILRWDGSTFAPLFAEVSNSPVIDLADLDGDGISEIALGQSGYCGSYAASPHMTFAFRWEDGAYRPATARYPGLNDGLDDRAGDVRPDTSGAGNHDARACIQHMFSMAHAFRGRPTKTRAAYRAYAQARQQVASDAPLTVRPIYLAAEYVEADLRATIAAASEPDSGWGRPERAVLHDLLADALLDRARAHQYRADYAAERGRTDEAREARRQASEVRQQATHEYVEALNLDPDDEEARRVLGQ